MSATDILPDGLTAAAMSGDGWIVDQGNLTAGRVDALLPGDSYPPLTVTVDVALDAPASVVNTAFVYYSGDETNVDNNTADDPTSIGQLEITHVSPDLSGGTINAGTSQIQIQFSSASLHGDDPSNYRLQSPGPDGLLGTADDEEIPFTLSFAENTATLTVPPLPENLYRLTVQDTITDTAGVRLDGDGDGQPGGDWAADFVAVPSNELLSSAATFPSSGSNPTSVAVGDFNGDGYKDLAVVNNPINGLAPSVQIFMNDGKGNFTPGTAVTAGLSNPYAVVVDDFTGDHKDDLAVANYGNNTVTIYRGDGRGGFLLLTTVNVGMHPINLGSGDFNGDGRKDIAVANYGDEVASPAVPGTLGILTGTGNGAFTYSSVGIGTNKEPVRLAIADFNGDGKLDIAMANYESNNVVIFKGTGTGGFTIQTTKSIGAGAIGPRSIAAGDFNGDGKVDLVVGNYVTDNVSVLLGNGTGGLSNATLFYTGSDTTAPLEATSPRSVAVADFNADGKADIVVTNRSTNNVGILLGDGSGGFAPALDLPGRRFVQPVRVSPWRTSTATSGPTLR